jgi:hypothetical protein
MDPNDFKTLDDKALKEKFGMGDEDLKTSKGSSYVKDYNHRKLHVVVT